MFERLFASRNRPCFAAASRWDSLVYDLSGNRLEISLPPQDYEFPEEDNGRRFNLFDQGMYSYETEPDRNGYPAHFEGVSRVLISRNWYTYGPVWQSQHIGTLHCAAVICDTSRMPYHLNCFNPSQMERLTIHALYYDSGPGFGNGTNQFDAPVNWQVKKLDQQEWLYFESWERRPEWEKFTHSTYGCHFTAWLATPLFADKYLLLSFSATGSLPAEPSNRTMFSRIKDIIPTINLTLSPEAQKQRATVQEQFPDVKYSPTREPETWKYYESYRDGNFMKGERQIVFEGPCSPPPALF